MFKKKIIKISLLLLMVISITLIFAISIRGNSGNPAADVLAAQHWTKNGPFELSPERGRYALAYSIVEDKSLEFSLPVAQFALPDLAFSNKGKFVSLFAPGVSFLILPGYIIGKYFGSAQVGAYALVSLVAILNFFLVRAISIKIGASKWAALLGAFAFSFASPAFAYGVDLYQHHFTVFLMLMSLYLVIVYKNIWSMAAVWFMCGISVVIDNPNVFLMFPLAVYALWAVLKPVIATRSITKMTLGGLKIILATVAFLPAIFFFLWYNNKAYGSLLQLPGTLPSVGTIDANTGQPIFGRMNKEKIVTSNPDDEKGNFEKTAISFFATRNLYNGFYEHFISPDRGIIYFTPVMLLSFFGLVIFYRRNDRLMSLFISMIGANVLLYSMWGDPYGGWAFGSRYLIPSYALLSILISLGIAKAKPRWPLVVLFAIFFSYSAWVNSLGALTSSANPPQIQVLSIEKDTGHEEKYTFLRNWEFLNGEYGSVGSKAFVFREFANNYISAFQYHSMVYFLILSFASVGALFSYRKYKV